MIFNKLFSRLLASRRQHEKNASQQQTAGSFVHQYQAGQSITVNQIQGITEERALQIFNENMQEEAIRRFSAEAQGVAAKRIQSLDAKLVDALSQAQTLGVIADPSFQILTKRAQLQAASTGENTDHEILTSLLLERSRYAEKPLHLIISKAVDVIGQIDQEALCGLMNLWFINLEPTAADAQLGLSAMNRLAQAFQQTPLPEGEAWIERLEILGCIRINPTLTPKKFDKILQGRSPGYFSRSFEQAEAIEINAKLAKVARGLENILHSDLINPDRPRAPGPSRKSLQANIMHNSRLPVEKVISALDILDEYKAFSVDVERVTRVNEYIEQNFHALWQYRSWWDGLTMSASVTRIGIAIAFANAKRFDNLAGLGTLQDRLK